MHTWVREHSDQNSIYCYENITYIRDTGKASGQHIGKGGEKTFVVDADVEGEQAGWAGVSADNDAVCVAWILVKQTDSSSDTAARWTGDVGRNCDQAWAYQNQVAGRYKDGDEEKEHKPACTWIDADHTGSTEIASIKFNVKSFGDDIKKIADESDKAICDHTAWGADNYPISGKCYNCARCTEFSY
jgi:hypothetical protein